MRFVGEVGGLELPDAREGRIVQLEPRIRTEHRHAFLQRVQGRGLDLDQRVVGAFQRKLLGHVFVEECETAEGMRLRHDAQGFAAGQMPEIFRQIFLGLAVERQALTLPRLIVALLRQLARLAQFVEHFAVGRSRVEPFFGQSPQLDKGAIVEAQLLFPIEDGDRRRQLVERVGMRVDMLLQTRLGVRHVGDVDGRADNAAVFQRRMRERQRAPLPRDDGEALGLEHLTLRPRGRRQIAFGFFKREVLLRRRFDIGRAGAREKRVIAP